MVPAMLLPVSSNRKTSSLRAASRSTTAGKRLDIDDDRLQRILGQRDAVRDDDRDRLADKADLVVRR